MNNANKLYIANYFIKRALFDDIRDAYNAYQTYKDFKGKYDNLSNTVQQGIGQFKNMLGQGGLPQLGNTIQQGIGQFKNMLGQGGLPQLGNTIQQGISGLMQGFNSNPMQAIQNVKPRAWPGSKAQLLPNPSPNIGGPSWQNAKPSVWPGYQPTNKAEEVKRWNTPDIDYIPPHSNSYQDYLKGLNPQHGKDPGFALPSNIPPYQGARPLPYRPGGKHGEMHKLPYRPGGKPSQIYLF